ncbi:MmcQ/YjbR family DNA-binding protein [Parvularcula sp. LCG005]|uniref:MmcQ/YjbR family DNA-binding protein n=1 Tax=Parvularcula sp. LCG005 TaxID=3078805 RepID=UPI002943A612|nr:MmcQ/YjbR family DNA-binding protein [Parvularcula sp. LCG005]WOI52835.1 MmcQ/YjbR family DNA-binding protein [Parvularcula sp. LCG005]
MDQKGFNAFCDALPTTTYVCQWGGADVWKVVDKVFAMGRDNGDLFAITFKVTPEQFALMADEPGLRGAPYLASRGMSWIQHYARPGLADDELKAYIAASHRLVAAGLSQKKQRAMGLLP